MNPLKRVPRITALDFRQFTDAMKRRRHPDDLRLESAMISGNDLEILETLIMHHDTEVIELDEGQAAIVNREDGQMAVLADELKRDWLAKYGSPVLQSIATYGPSDNRHLGARLEMSENIVEMTCLLLREAGALQDSEKAQCDSRKN